MSLSLVVLIGVLFGTGTYLLLHRTLTRIALGVAMLGNGINVLILSTGARSGDAPIVGRDGPLTDSVPQALVLTAIVIGLSIQALLLVVVTRLSRIDPGLDLASFDQGGRR